MELTVLRGARGAQTKAVRPRVYDENFQEIEGVEVASIRHRLGSTPGEAVMELAMDSFRKETVNGATRTSERRMEAVREKRSPVQFDQRVWVGVPLDGKSVLMLFAGRITECEAAFAGKPGKAMERATLTAHDARHELAARQVIGRYYYDETTGRRKTDLAAVMNPGGTGNRDGEHVWQEGGSAGLFAETGEKAKAWHGAEALEYVLAHHCEGVELELPKEALQTKSLTEQLPEFALEGDSCAEAIWKILRATGLNAWVDPTHTTGSQGTGTDGIRPTLRLVEPGTAPTRDAKLARAGSTFSRESTEAEKGKIGWSARGTRNQWRVRGALKEYEARFELTKLWTSDEEAQVRDNPDCARRGYAGYDPRMDPVFRQWGLNEDGRWSERTTHDFSELFEGAVRRRRKFGTPFRGTGDEVRPMVVEVQSEKLPAGWHRVGNGTVRTLADRAGIYFDCEDVDGLRSGLWAGSARTFVALKEVSAVRVTATIEGDERVTTTSERTEGSATELTLEHTVTDENYRWRKRDESSIYSGDGTGIIRDDSAEGGAMEQRAEKLREENEGTEIGSRLSIPWVDLSWRPGTRVKRLAGREIDLSANGGESPRYPTVAEVTWDFAQQTTELALACDGRAETGEAGG